mgnify:FL=1
MKLSKLILEQRNRPKLIIMAGGAGTGKSYLINQLDLGTLRLVNPDKFIEDPNSPAYNKLTPGTALANKEAEALADDKISFVFDTTASNPKKVDEFLSKGYDIYMVMVYSHPVIAYISNAKRKRKVPSSAVFSTWRNVYKLIKNYNKKLKGNLSIFVNDRGGEYKNEVEQFNTAARNGAAGISDYLERLNKRLGLDVASTFRNPIKLSKQEEDEFYKAVKDIDYDTSSYGEDRALKSYFQKMYNRDGLPPGDDQMKKTLDTYRRKKVNDADRAKDVLDDIADTIYDPVFLEKLKHSSVAEIDNKIQNFLA